MFLTRDREIERERERERASETKRQRDREAARQRDREAERQRGREGERQRGRETDRQAERQTDDSQKTVRQLSGKQSDKCQTNDCKPIVPKLSQNCTPNVPSISTQKKEHTRSDRQGPRQPFECFSNAL